MLFIIVLLAIIGVKMSSIFLFITVPVLIISSLAFYKLSSYKLYYLCVFSPIVLGILTLFIIYRIPVGPEKIYTAERGHSWRNFYYASILRAEFERMFGNRKVHLNDIKFTSCYVTPSDYKKLEPEPIVTMLKKNYKIIATVKVRGTLDGGCAVVSVIDTMRVVGQPPFHK